MNECTALVHSDCYNKTPQTGSLINNRNLFLTVLEAKKPKIRVPAWSGEGPRQGCRLLVVSSHDRRELFRASFVRALILFPRAPPS